MNEWLCRCNCPAMSCTLLLQPSPLAILRTESKHLHETCTKTLRCLTCTHKKFPLGYKIRFSPMHKSFSNELRLILGWVCLTVVTNSENHFYAPLRLLNIHRHRRVQLYYPHFDWSKQ